MVLGLLCKKKRENGKGRWTERKRERVLLLPYFPADTLITTAGRRVVVRSCSLGGSVETVGRVTGGRSTVVRGAGVGTGGSATQACGLSPSCIFAHRRLFVCCQPAEEEGIKIPRLQRRNFITYRVAARRSSCCSAADSDWTPPCRSVDRVTAHRSPVPAASVGR